MRDRTAEDAGKGALARRWVQRLRERVPWQAQAFLAAVALGLTALTWGPAVAAAIGRSVPRWAMFVHAACAPFCHQIPSRSFHVQNYVFPLCARCSGMWLGITLGVAVAALRPLRRRWAMGLGLAIVATALSWIDHVREQATADGWAWARFVLGVGIYVGITMALTFDLLALVVAAGRRLTSHGLGWWRGPGPVTSKDPPRPRQ